MGFFKGLFRSLRKSRRLRDISLRLAGPLFTFATADPLETMMARASEKKQAEEELYDLCESDPNVRSVMQVYGASRETLRTVYMRLVAVGAGQWAAGHYVAASALVFPPTLDYLLRNNFHEELPFGPDVLAVDLSSERPARAIVLRIAFRLIQYFENREVGPVRVATNDLDYGRNRPTNSKAREAGSVQVINEDIELVARRVNGILADYVAIDDDIFKFSLRKMIPIPGFFKAIQYRQHADQLQQLHTTLVESLDAIDAYLENLDMSSTTSSFLRTLREYTAALAETVSILSEISSHLNRNTPGGPKDYHWTQYRRDVREYQASIQRYLALGPRMNELWPPLK